MARISQEEIEGYQAVDATWQFDLQFYREIGLNLNALEDPDYTAAMPRLRRAASLVSETVSRPTTDGIRERAKTLLLKTHDAVRGLISNALAGVELSSVNAAHPAVVSWQERNAQSEHPSSRAVAEHLGKVDLINLGLMRPVLPELDPDYMVEKYKWRPITLPNANYYYQPETVADQLVYARAGLWFDI